MKTIKQIISVLCLGLAVTACSSDDGEKITATQISNLHLQSNPGSINLVWEYPEGDNTNRYIEIRYYDPEKKKDILRTISGVNTSITIENTRKKYGEYKFSVRPFSTTFTPGDNQEVSGISEPAPAINTFTSSELQLTIDDISISGNQPDGTVITPPTADGNDIKNVLDANLKTRVNPNYYLAQNGAIFYIDVVYSKPQKFLQFSYNSPNAGNVPVEIECYVRANLESEWTLVTTLTKENDMLPTDKVGTLFKSKEYQAPFEFKYFRYRVTKTDTGKPNFSISEFRIFDVEHYFYDPEASE